MKVPPFPNRLEIELSSACNLRCAYCPRQFINNLKDFMDFALLRRLVDEAAIYPDTIVVLHRRGESLLHPQFLDILDYVCGKFKEVQLATNATLLDKKMAKAIIETVTFLSFSIDTPYRYEKVRLPAKYQKVDANINMFLEMNEVCGKPVKTQVSMVKTPDVYDNDELFFENIWADKVDRVRIYDQHSADGQFGSLLQKRLERKTCVMPFYEMVIYCDGKVARCNHDWNGAPLADVQNHKISDIWHNDTYHDLRHQQETLQIKDSVCAHCDSWYPKKGYQGTGKVLEK